MTTMGAAEFKSKCLSVLDTVQSERTPITITKRGKPVAIVSPVESKRPTRMDSWKGFGWIDSDIVNFNEADGWGSEK